MTYEEELRQDREENIRVSAFQKGAEWALEQMKGSMSENFDWWKSEYNDMKIANVAIEHDPGDRSVGIEPYTFVALTDNQEGTILGALADLADYRLQVLYNNGKAL